MCWQDRTLALLRTMGLAGNDTEVVVSDSGGGRGTRRQAGNSGRAASPGGDGDAGCEDDTCSPEHPDLPGSLGGRLQDLGRQLLQEINAAAAVQTQRNSAASAGMVLPRSLSMRSVGSDARRLARSGMGGVSRRG